MDSCLQQNNKARHSFESQGSSHSTLAPRMVLRETNNNPQLYAPETTNLGQAKHAVASQPTITSILELRQKSRTHIRQLYPVQRIQRYRQYRADQREKAQKNQQLYPEPKDTKSRDPKLKSANSKDDSPTWPDEIEDAFIEALYKVPPIGRRKLTIRRKPCGRNELISEYILKKTGVARDRKQVSSHIQVLKGFMGNEPEFMKLVTSKKSLGAFDENPFPTNEVTRLFVSGDPPPNNQEGDLQPNRPPRITQGTFIDSQLASSVQASIHPLTFEIWLQSSSKDTAQEKSLHTYTSLEPDMPLSSASLESLRDWRSRFPHLAILHQDGAVSSQVILFNVSFNMVAVLPSTPTFLCTRFEVKCSDAYTCHTWKCNTRIYKHGVLVGDRSQDVFPDCSQDGTSKITLPFASNFWSTTFTSTFNIAGQGPRSHLNSGGDMDMENDDTASALQEISVVQELLATSTICQSAPERVTLFLWEFNKAVPGEAGGATWRHVIPPPCRILTNSPSLGCYPELNLGPTSNESSNASAIEHWEPTSISSINLYSENYNQHSYNLANVSPFEILSSNPAYYAPYAHGTSQESIQAAIGDAGQLNYFPYDSSIPFALLPDESQQYMSQWPQYPSPLSGSQFPMSVSF